MQEIVDQDQIAENVLKKVLQQLNADRKQEILTLLSKNAEQ
jgi:hypothetical protein